MGPDAQWHSADLPTTANDCVSPELATCRTPAAPRRRDAVRCCAHRTGRRLVTEWLPIVASGVSGAVVTLLGVITGGAMTSRGQRRQWNRDKQIDAAPQHRAGHILDFG